MSADIPYLVGVQCLAGAAWAAYELAVVLLFFEAASHRERTGVVTVYNLGHALAWVVGAASGGLLLRSLGEDRNAYFTVFAVSTVLRLAAIPLLRRVHLPTQKSKEAGEPDGDGEGSESLDRGGGEEGVAATDVLLPGDGILAGDAVLPGDAIPDGD